MSIKSIYITTHKQKIEKKYNFIGKSLKNIIILCIINLKRHNDQTTEEMNYGN